MTAGYRHLQSHFDQQLFQRFQRKDFVGVHHVGFWVEDLEDAEKKAIEAGAKFFADLPVEKESLYYEKKFQAPDGIIFDMTPNGWIGTKK